MRWEIHLVRTSQLVVRMRHSESKAMWEEAIVRSGEIGSLREGRRVGESRLSRKSEFVSDFLMRISLAYANVHV